jgi:hypothetical protein
MTEFNADTRLRVKFSPIWPFKNNFREINPIKNPNLALLSRVRADGATSEGVAPSALARLDSTVPPVVPRRFSHARAEGVTDA